MNLYLISQTFNSGYDTYSDAVVCAETEAEARKWHPSGNKCSTEEEFKKAGDWDWATSYKDVTVKLVGTAVDGLNAGVVCASFHAG